MSSYQLIFFFNIFKTIAGINQIRYSQLYNFVYYSLLKCNIKLPRLITLSTAQCLRFTVIGNLSVHMLKYMEH